MFSSNCSSLNICSSNLSTFSSRCSNDLLIRDTNFKNGNSTSPNNFSSEIPGISMIQSAQSTLTNSTDDQFEIENVNDKGTTISVIADTCLTNIFERNSVAPEPDEVINEKISEQFELPQTSVQFSSSETAQDQDKICSLIPSSDPTNNLANYIAIRKSNGKVCYFDKALFLDLMENTLRKQSKVDEYSSLIDSAPISPDSQSEDHM